MKLHGLRRWNKSGPLFRRHISGYAIYLGIVGADIKSGIIPNVMLLSIICLSP